MSDERLLMTGIEVVREMRLEFVHQERSALFAAAFVSDRVLNLYLFEDCTVVELDGDGVANGALFRVVIVGAEPGVLDAGDLGTEVVDAGIGGRLVRTVKSLEFLDDQQRARRHTSSQS